MFRKSRRAEAARPHKDSEEIQKSALKATEIDSRSAPKPSVAPAPGKRAPASSASTEPESKEHRQPAERVSAKTAKSAAGMHKAAPAGEKPAPTAEKPVPERADGVVQEKAHHLLAELEDRVVRALGLLEAQAGALAASLAKPQAPSVPEPRGDASQDCLDEITTAFRRALGEALDRKLEEFLAPLVGLHGKLGDGLRILEEDSRGSKNGDLEATLADAVSELEKILRAFGGSFIAPTGGECYDPLIHLAVAEEPSSGGSENVVTRVLRPGYKTSRGKVVLPARVLVARR